MNGQLNVTPITDKQPQPSCEFKITCVVDGYPVELTGHGRADDLRALVGRLRAIGATPPMVGKPQLPNSDHTDDAPVCQYHGAMKPSKFGGYFCPKKMGDGSHCKSKSA